jgi:hypothetical protein
LACTEEVSLLGIVTLALVKILMVSEAIEGAPDFARLSLPLCPSLPPNLIELSFIFATAFGTAPLAVLALNSTPASNMASTAPPSSSLPPPGPSSSLPSSSTSSTDPSTQGKPRDLSYLRTLALQTKARRLQEAKAAAATAEATYATILSPSSSSNSLGPASNGIASASPLHSSSASSSTVANILPTTSARQDSDREEGEISDEGEEQEPSSVPSALQASTSRPSSPPRQHPALSPLPYNSHPSSQHSTPRPRFPPPSIALLENFKGNAIKRETKRPNTEMDDEPEVKEPEEADPVKEGASVLKSVFPPLRPRLPWRHADQSPASFLFVFQSRKNSTPRAVSYSSSFFRGASLPSISSKPACRERARSFSSRTSRFVCRATYRAGEAYRN